MFANPELLPMIKNLVHTLRNLGVKPDYSSFKWAMVRNWRRDNSGKVIMG